MNAVLGKTAVWKLQRAEPCVSCLSKTAVREPKAVETRQRAFGEHDNRFLVHSHIWLLPLNPDRFSYLLRVKHGADRRPAMPAQETRSLLSLHHSPAAGKAYWREYRRGERVALPAPAIKHNSTFLRVAAQARKLAVKKVPKRAHVWSCRRSTEKTAACFHLHCT